MIGEVQSAGVALWRREVGGLVKHGLKAVSETPGVVRELLDPVDPRNHALVDPSAPSDGSQSPSVLMGEADAEEPPPAEGRQAPSA